MRAVDSVKCTYPATSRGGAAKCDICFPGYYFNDGSCRPCPRVRGESMACLGEGSPPLPKQGYWMDTEEPDPEKQFIACPLGKAACKGCTSMSDCTAVTQCKDVLGDRACNVPRLGYWKNPFNFKHQKIENWFEATTSSKRFWWCWE